MPDLPDVERILAAVAERRPSLALETLDLGFLIALFLRGQAAQLAAFSEAGLSEVFEQVCGVLEPSAEQRKKRATYAIARLREQRLLARVDGHGVVRSGEYALTRLASGIVEFFLDEDVLTSESLSLLMGTLRSTLGEVLDAARAAGSGEPALWTSRVVGPLRVTVAELVAGIARRQRGLDLQQERFQSEIRLLLESDWFGAIERCQGLLEATSATLRELTEILLRDSTALLGLLSDIEDLALEHAQPEAERASLLAIEQLDRIAAWGGARQRAWSEYFQYVHRYLRDVVRLDPKRALTQRLREQLSSAAGRRFALTLAAAEPMRVLRTVAPSVVRPVVSRPRAPREKEPAEDRGVNAQAELERRVAVELAAGADSLSALTDRINVEIDESERFAMTGKVAQTAARLSQVRTEREKPWVRLEGAIEIEEWQLQARTTAADGCESGE